tara:strand:- start:648 stop:815 length:168 start_codon:yes stop_codon:yes gene_type:complete
LGFGFWLEVLFASSMNPFCQTCRVVDVSRVTPDEKSHIYLNQPPRFLHLGFVSDM